MAIPLDLFLCRNILTHLPFDDCERQTFAQYENEKGASLSNTATATVALVDPTASSIVTLTPSTASAAATSDSASASASSSSGTSSNKTSGGVSALPGGAFALVPMAVGALMGAFFAL